MRTRADCELVNVPHINVMNFSPFSQERERKSEISPNYMNRYASVSGS